MPDSRPLLLLLALGLSLLSSRGASAGEAKDDGKEASVSDDAKQRKVDEMFAEARKKFPDVPVVTVAELAAMQAEGPVVIVDVRTPEEQEVSMIPGAVTREQFDAERDRHAGGKVVAYCTIGYRSGLYAKELRKAGIDAHDLAGSILAWAHAGKPLEAAGQPTKRVHVYGAKWDLLPTGYEAVR